MRRSIVAWIVSELNTRIRLLESERSGKWGRVVYIAANSCESQVGLAASPSWNGYNTAHGGGGSGAFRLAKVPSADWELAFRFHRGIADSNAHIWPRDAAQIRGYAEDGCLFGARDDAGAFVALCYATLDEGAGEDGEWEVGGLTVAASVQNGGIGTALLRVAIAHTLVYEQPIQNNQRIITHVHEANDDPRGILARLAFERLPEKVELPGDRAPASMKRNDQGNLVGHVFRFADRGIQNLDHWFNQEFDGTLRGGQPVEVDLGQNTLDELKSSLREIAAATEVKPTTTTQAEEIAAAGMADGCRQSPVDGAPHPEHTNLPGAPRPGLLGFEPAVGEGPEGRSPAPPNRSES